MRKKLYMILAVVWLLLAALYGYQGDFLRVGMYLALTASMTSYWFALEKGNTKLVYVAYVCIGIAIAFLIAALRA
jgi:hypothetical protein